jgi:hypothetical protein
MKPSTPRPKSIRTALWIGWICIALIFFNPGTMMNIGHNFIYWLPSLLLFGIPLTLVTLGRNSGRLALNVILPAMLLFMGYNLLRLLEVIDPLSLILFVFMSCFVWLPLVYMLISLNRQDAKEWFQSSLMVPPTTPLILP